MKSGGDEFDVSEGDLLVLREYEPIGGGYTGREVCKKVSYVFRTKDLFLNDDAFIVMGLEKEGKGNDPDGDTKANFEDLSETLQKFLYEFPVAVSVYRKLNPGVDKKDGE